MHHRKGILNRGRWGHVFEYSVLRGSAILDRDFFLDPHPLKHTYYHSRARNKLFPGYEKVVAQDCFIQIHSSVPVRPIIHLSASRLAHSTAQSLSKLTCCPSGRAGSLGTVQSPPCYYFNTLTHYRISDYVVKSSLHHPYHRLRMWSGRNERAHSSPPTH